MSKLFAVLMITAALAVPAVAQEKKITKKDLPAAVQKAVDEQTKGAEIVGYTKEVEKGKTEYEVETKVNGHTRDLLFDPAGKLIVAEEETPIDKIPAAAKATIEKKAGDGKITIVETLTKGTTVTYEAVITPKKGKKFEVQVDANGKEVKE